MKKKLRLIIISLVCISITSAGFAVSNEIRGILKANYSFRVNDELLQIPSNLLILNREGTTYVPLRFLTENLGAEVGFKNGIIDIKGAGLIEQETLPSIKEMNNLKNQLDLLKKENASLNIQLQRMKENYDDINAYNALPVTINNSSGIETTVTGISNAGNKETRLDVSFVNNGNLDTYYMQPRKTVVKIDGKEYSTVHYTGNLITTLTTKDSTSGSNVIEGSIYLDYFETKGAKGSVTFYYTVNNSQSEQSLTIYFDLGQ